MKVFGCIVIRFYTQHLTIGRRITEACVWLGDTTSARPFGTPPIRSEATACTGHIGLIKGREKLLFHDRNIMSMEGK